MKKISLDYSDVRSLTRSIIIRAVLDWGLLKHGEKVYTITDGDGIYRNDLLEFFYSDRFKLFCLNATERSPEQIRRAIGLPYRTFEEAREHFDLC